jgi:phosphatidylinositol-3-phosphatase
MLVVSLVVAIASSAPLTSTARSAAAVGTSPCGTQSTIPAYKHVIVIVDENKSYSSIVGSANAPYLNQVIGECGVARNFHNVTHQSLPNYLALTSGLPLTRLGGFVNDCVPARCQSVLRSNNVFHQMASRGWGSYAESMPQACARSDAANYAPKHNPAVYFTDVASSCGTRDVELGSPSQSALLTALADDRHAPAFSLVVANLCNDMHNCPVVTGDTWLKTWIPRITSSKTYRSHDTVVFIVWDEGEGGSAGENCLSTQDPSCHVPAVVIAPSVKPGTISSTRFTLYSVLKTVEQLFHVDQLGSAKGARSMTTAFRL